jgi:hypothetical protein
LLMRTSFIIHYPKWAESAIPHERSVGLSAEMWLALPVGNIAAKRVCNGLQR